MPRCRCGIERLGKRYYCPLKAKVGLGPGQAYEDSLSWSQQETAQGRLIPIRKMPKDHRVKLSRVVLSPERTDYVITNDLTQETTQGAQQESGVRWKIEHRDVKQTTGIERCPCRRERLQRNHIGCAILVWVRLKSFAEELGTRVYALKRDLLSDSMVEQLRNPSIKMALA